MPLEKTVLLVGPPGAGKSTFCQQTVLQNLAVDKPVIFVTTEYGTRDAEAFLKERGLTKAYTGLLNYIDGYNQTVGLPVTNRPDTLNVNCGNLTNLGIALTRHQRKISRKGILVVFDSLTSPYLFCGSTVVRFFKLTLNRFAGDGNSVMVCFDEGCSKEEDLVGMMSISDGVVKINTEGDRRVFKVIKHPKMRPKEFDISLTPYLPEFSYFSDRQHFIQSVKFALGLPGIIFRKEIGDYVNIAWRNLILWSGMLWDPKRFPMMIYDFIKQSYNLRNYDVDIPSFLPWQKRLAYRLFMPKSFSKVKDMKRAMRGFQKNLESDYRIGKVEYLEKISKTDEHYLRIHENYECWGFENVGACLGLVRSAMTAASLSAMEKKERDWNIIETKCIGLGDHYCEKKMVPGEIDELRSSLEKNRPVIVEINARIMDYILGFLLHGKPLMERPSLGSFVHILDLQRITIAPALMDDFQLILRMGGAKAGKMIGERLMDSGLKEQKAVNQILKLIDQCKVGKISLDNTVRIWENCEMSGFKFAEPSCYFTTGFLNGFFYAVKNQHVSETKCIAIGDPYCEWEFS